MPVGETSSKPNIINTPTTISQSASMTVTRGSSVACVDQFGVTYQDSWLRRFDLNGAYGIVTPFTVSSVDFGVEQAFGSSGGAQALTINLYTVPNAAPMLYSNFTLIGTATFNVADQTLTNLSQSVIGTVMDTPSNDLVVEIASPSTGSTFFVGANSDGETAPTYLASVDCGLSDPLTTGDIGFPGTNMVMAVHGDSPVRALASSWGHVKATYR